MPDVELLPYVLTILLCHIIAGCLIHLLNQTSICIPGENIHPFIVELLVEQAITILVSQTPALLNHIIAFLCSLLLR